MKQLIKYCAVILALLLAASIIGGCLMAGVNLAQTLIDETKIPEELEGDNSIWYRTEDGDVVFLGMHFGGSQGVKSGTVTEINPEEVRRLNIESAAGELVIEVGDSYRVDFENIPDDYIIEVALGALNIYREDKIFVWNSVLRETPKLHITVPEGTVLDKIDVDSGSGSVRISEVVTETFWLDSGSGNVTISNVTAEDARFNTGSGSLTVKESVLGETEVDAGSGFITFDEVKASNLVVDSGSGRINYEGELTGNCVFETGSGAVNLDIYGKEEDYNIRADLGSGGLYINGKKEQNTDIEYDNARNLLIFDTGSGRVSIKYHESSDNTR